MTAEHEVLAEEVIDAVEPLLRTLASAEEGLVPRVPPSQLRALRFIAQARWTNLAGLAHALGTTPPAASRLCDRMVAAGLILRELNPANRREVTLRLSPDGTALLAELSARRRERLVGILQAMPPAGREALVSGLRAFADQGVSGPRGRGADRAPSGKGGQGSGAYALQLLW